MNLFPAFRIFLAPARKVGFVSFLRFQYNGGEAPVGAPSLKEVPFSRAGSGATVIDKSGNTEPIAENEPAWSYPVGGGGCQSLWLRPVDGAVAADQVGDLDDFFFPGTSRGRVLIQFSYSDVNGSTESLFRFGNKFSLRATATGLEVFDVVNDVVALALAADTDHKLLVEYSAERLSIWLAGEEEYNANGDFSITTCTDLLSRDLTLRVSNMAFSPSLGKNNENATFTSA